MVDSGCDGTPSITTRRDETSREFDGNGGDRMKAEVRLMAGPLWRLTLTTGNINLSLSWGESVLGGVHNEKND